MVEDAEDPTGEAPAAFDPSSFPPPFPFLDMNPQPMQEGLAGQSRSASGGLAITLPELPSASASAATTTFPSINLLRQNSRAPMQPSHRGAAAPAAAAGAGACAGKKRPATEEASKDDKKSKNSRPSGPNPRQGITTALGSLAQTLGQGASGRAESQCTMQMMMMMQMQQAAQQAAAQQQLMMALLAPRAAPSYTTPPVPNNFWDPVPPRPRRPSTSSSSSSSSSAAAASSSSAWPYADDCEEMDYQNSQDF